MRTIGHVTLLLGAIGAVIAGLESLLAHFTAGDLLNQMCTAADAAAWSGQCPSNLIRFAGQIGVGGAAAVHQWNILRGAAPDDGSATPATPTQVVVPPAAAAKKGG